MDGVEFVGTLNATAWYKTLALILSNKYGAKVTVQVTPPVDEERAAKRKKGEADQWPKSHTRAVSG